MMTFKRHFILMAALLCLFSLLTIISTASCDTVSLLKKYEGLLNDKKIARAMIWINEHGKDSYENWTKVEKEQLEDAIHRLEYNEPFPMQSPPLLIDDKYISEYDAWTIYITHVAHTLWLEVNHLVTWSILDYTSEELALLLDSTQIFRWDPKGYTFDTYRMGMVTDWNVDISYQFMKDNQYILKDQASTVYAFASWIRNNVVHYYINSVNETEEDCRERFWLYRGLPPVDRILYPLTNPNGSGYSFSAGCWGTTGLFSAVLRSVNIPVNNTQVSLNTPGSRSLGNHSTIILPTIGIGLCHSDDLYGAWNSFPKHFTSVPTEKLFHCLDWLNENIFNPSNLDRSDIHYNSSSEQASYNHSKYNLDLATEYLSGYLLYLRSLDSSQKVMASGLIECFTGDSVGGGIVYYAKPFYTEVEIAQFIRKIDNEIIRIGNGDWKKGASIIRKNGRPLVIDLTSGNNTVPFDILSLPDAIKQQIVIKSSNKSIITTSDTGMVTGLKKGTATITVTKTDGTRFKAADRIVIVTYYAKKIDISGDETVTSGKTIKLKADVLPKETVNKKVKWESSDADIATVSVSGVVTAKKVSETKTVAITATALDGSGVTAEWKLTVTPDI